MCSKITSSNAGAVRPSGHIYFPHADPVAEMGAHYIYTIFLHVVQLYILSQSLTDVVTVTYVFVLI